MKQPLILIGGGGHCKSCIDVIEAEGKYDIAGILDVKEKVGTSVLNYKIIGTEDDIEHFSAKEYVFFITVGQLSNAGVRIKLSELLRLTSRSMAKIMSPYAHVSKYSTVGQGTIVMHGAKINAGCTIGGSCILNTNANIEHDCVIGDFTHVSTGAIINGNCIVGNGVFIGSNAVLVNGITLGSSITIGAGSVVNKSASEPGVYVGNPFRKLK